MRKKLVVLLIVFAFLNVASFSFVLMATSANTTKTISYEPIDIGPELRGTEVDLSVDLKFKESSSPSSSGLQTSAGLGIYNIWIWYDDTVGLYLAEYELYSVGTECELWVMTDLSWGTPGDPRPTPVITIEQADYMVEQFDTVIYPALGGYFGNEDFHDGSYAALPFGYYDPDGKTVILVSNIGDENYYDYTYPSYIAGFYWGDVFEFYCDRNVISIDAYDWERRTGPQDPPVPGSRPYLYESIFAHEFQHLLHADIFPGDETYMNEACSNYAEPLCGYPVDYGQIEWFLATPDNSLTEWGDQGGINILADYGAAFLWAVYLEEHYGPNFISEYVQATGLPKSSIDRINALLPDGVDFYSVFHDWRIANLLDGVVSDELYNYETLNLDELDPLRIYEIDKKKIPWITSEWFGQTYTHPTQYAPDGYPTKTTELGPFSSDYITLTGFQGEKLFTFDGDDQAKYPFEWNYDGDEGWHTKKGNLMNILLAGEAYVDPLDPKLRVNTYWDIEAYWDYGFVQISTDDGETWTSLENEYTTYLHVPACIGKAVDILPGLTGHSGGPIAMEFNLAGYEDQDVLIGFRYITDWGTFENGWYINEASASGNSIDLENVPYEADFMVSILGKTGNDYVKYSFEIDDEFEIGFGTFNWDDFDELILIISPISEYGIVDYKFRAV